MPNLTSTLLNRSRPPAGKSQLILRDAREPGVLARIGKHKKALATEIMVDGEIYQRATGGKEAVTTKFLSFRILKKVPRSPLPIQEIITDRNLRRKHAKCSNDLALFITRHNPDSEVWAFDFRLTCPPKKSQIRCNMFSYDCLSGCSRNIGLDYGFHETFVTGGINNENYS